MRLAGSSNEIFTDCGIPQVGNKEGMAMKPVYASFWVLSLFALTFGMQSRAASAADEMKADQSAGERIGGQAGLRYHQEKLEGVADQSAGERIGGQAGLRFHQEKLEGVANQSAGERIGSQAGLKGE